MAGRLPQPIAESLTRHHGNPATFSREEFIARMAIRDEVNADLGEEFDDLVAQIPNEFEELFSTSDREVGS